VLLLLQLLDVSLSGSLGQAGLQGTSTIQIGWNHYRLLCRKFRHVQVHMASDND
jgi:hypothetical protein